MHQSANVTWHNTNVDEWPRCELPGCPDRFMERTSENVRRHFDREHPGVSPVQS
jgi:hypothetical protein